MKQTGSLSRIEDLIRPLASAGEAGQTTFIPGVLAAKFSGVCEWVAPTFVPPFAGPLKTTGTLIKPPDIYLTLAALLKI